MPRMLYCRHCGFSYESHAGKILATCPHCQHSGLWSTDPTPVDETPPALSENDRRFLRSLRIVPEI